MGNVIPRLTQFIQNFPRPGGGGGGAGGLFQGLGNRPLGGRPLGSRPLANLLASGSSSSGSIAAAGTAGGAASAAGSATSGGSFFFRRSSEVIPWDLPKIFSKLKNVYKKYKMDNPDCQRLLICEMYRRGTSIKIGNMADRFLRILRAEARLDGATTFTSRTKSTLKEFLKAAQHGLAHQECSVIYSRCSGDSVSAAKSRDEHYPLNKEQ
ncbi:uncharacterized protein [Centruroides vittatus]|uniref:uncharacterized protein n=1 Tax=Centruroides vittatus TaxID=120091 RepID=UPI00350E9E7C